MYMKLIHCADLHLDSRMESGLSAEKALERRLELLRTFTRMVEQAEKEQVEAVLICGDLFDARTISVRAGNCVLDAIRMHPQIIFYYLQGNHDQNGFLDGSRPLPENLRTFGSDWTSYEQGNVTITGAELSEETGEDLMERLVLDRNRQNIVMLHGMITEYGGKDQTDVFSVRALRGKGIDYLALGHIHSYRLERLDDRGVWCYSGCMEGRGFDECGEKGYVALEAAGGRIVPSFVPFAERTLHEVPVDVTGMLTQEEIRRKILKELASIPQKDMVRICLTGRVDPEAERDPEWIRKWLEDAYYFLKVKDKTRLRIRPEDYQYDVSLKGEFIRLVLASDLADNEKEEILQRGIHALAGEG